MPGPWVKPTDLLQEVADILKIDVPTLQDYWKRLVLRCVVDGYNDIVNILAGKGYTLAQMDAWDSRSTYNRDQSLFWILTRGSGLGGYDQTAIDKMDRRKELTTSATILVNGVAVAPGATGDVGGVGGGQISEDGFRINSGTEF